MSRLLKKHARLVKLVFQVLDETATAAQEQELADLIRKDPEAQTVYLQLIDIHSNLILSASPIPATPSDALSSTRANQNRRKELAKKEINKKKMLLVTASLLLTCSTLFYIGYLVTSKSTEVEQNRIAAVDKSRLQVEQRMLDDGSLQLSFPTGVKVLISPNSAFQVTGNNGLHLTRGMLFAKVTTPAGKGFTVDTPRGAIVDLGTVFGVEVDEKKTAAVQVFKGEVELAGPTGEKIPLTEGETMFAEASENQWQPSENVSPRFLTAVQKLNDTFFPGMSYLRRTKVTFIYQATDGALPNPPVQSPSYIMYSETPAAERFRDLVPDPQHWNSQAAHFVEVKFNQSSSAWQLHFKNQYFNFTPVKSDVLIAQAEAHEKNEAGEWTRRVTLWEEESGMIHGLRYGDQLHELSIRPDWFSDNPDVGDFMIVKNIYYP